MDPSGPVEHVPCGYRRIVGCRCFLQRHKRDTGVGPCPDREGCEFLPYSMNPRFDGWVAVAVVLVLIGSARIASTWTIFSHTIDEPDHMPPGMEWLSIGKYRYEDQHRPRARVFGAVGPLLAGERFRPGPDSYHDGYRILGRDSHYDRILALGRAGILPFFWVACLVVYRWATRINGRRAGVFA